MDPALLVVDVQQGFDNSDYWGEPDLHGRLQERGISQLVLCGITANHCCETTARTGGNLGYDVHFVLDATHTFNRGDLTAAQLHATSTDHSAAPAAPAIREVHGVGSTGPPPKEARVNGTS